VLSTFIGFDAVDVHFSVLFVLMKCRVKLFSLTHSLIVDLSPQQVKSQCFCVWVKHAYHVIYCRLSEVNLLLRTFRSEDLSFLALLHTSPAVVDQFMA